MGKPQGRTAVTASVPAPTGGWNARDAISAMPITDAVSMVNFFPTPTQVQIRKGWIKHSTGITGRVNTVMNYAGLSNQNLFAAAGDTLYDVNSDVAFPVLTIGNDKLYYSNFDNTGGNYLVACNGVDPTLVYDGDKWSKMASTNTPVLIDTVTHVGNLVTVTTKTPHKLATDNSITITDFLPVEYNGKYNVTVTGIDTFTYTTVNTPATDPTHTGVYTINYGIEGVNPANFAQVNLFKNRLYFVEKNTLNTWYLPVDAIGGTAKPLYFGGIAQNGGFLQAMGTWTLDAGQGADDYAVWATNMGEVIVYNGTDPDTADTWALKGVWQFGFVFTRRCFYKWAGDLLMLSQDGLVPLSGALQSSRLNPKVFLTDKIFYEISQEADKYSREYGWQIIYFAKPNMLMVNIPNQLMPEQYVMHTINQSWAQFQGIDTTCWELQNDNMYFGGNGFVGRFWETFADDGKEVSATCQQAYSYFDSPGQQKRFTLIRPTLFVDVGAPGLYAGVNTDFQSQNNLGKVQFAGDFGVAGVWDLGKWDECVWGGGLTAYSQWQGVSGIGYSAGINLNMISKGIDVRWVSTDYVMEKGSVI